MKASINAAQDVSGRGEMMQAAFANQQIGYLQNMPAHRFLIDISRLPETVGKQLEAAGR